MGLLQDLALKTLYFAGNAAAAEITRRLALPLSPTIEILDHLRRERLCEVTGGDGQSPATPWSRADPIRRPGHWERPWPRSIR